MSVSVYECEPVSAADALFHAVVLVQVFASIVAVVPVVLSFSVAVAQSYVTVSVHTTRYQKDRVPPVAGAVGVSVAEVSLGAPVAVRLCVAVEPLVRAVEMADVPVWAWTEERVGGLAVTEVSLGGGGAVTVSVTVALCIALVAVPVT